MNLNKNISVWRGNDTPPTDYHLWEKEDGSILTKIDGEWKQSTSPEDKEALDKIKDIKSEALGKTPFHRYHASTGEIHYDAYTVAGQKAVDTSVHTLTIPLVSPGNGADYPGLMSGEDKISLDNLVDTIHNTEESGFYITDSGGNIALKYDTNGLDSAKVSNHFLEIVTSEVGNADTLDGYHAIDVNQAWYKLCESTEGVRKWFKISTIVSTDANNTNNDWMIEIYSYSNQNYSGSAHGYLYCTNFETNTTIVLNTGSYSNVVKHHCLYATVDKNRNIWLGVLADGTACQTCFRIIQKSPTNIIVTSDWESTTSSPNNVWVTRNGNLRNYNGTVGHLESNNIDVDYAVLASKFSTARTLTVGNTGKTFDGSGDVSWSLSEIGAVPLNDNNKIDSTYLPSYVDDVLEYTSKDNFPTTGETGKIYVTTDTNLTYRWTGSTYVEISQSLALGETATTAFAGDKGKLAYEEAKSSFGNVGKSTTADKVSLQLTKNDGTIVNIGIESATKSTAGVMSATDKTNLDKVESKAVGTKSCFKHTSSLGDIYYTPYNVDDELQDVNNPLITIPLAKPVSGADYSGVISGSDKIKLDNSITVAGNGLEKVSENDEYKLNILIDPEDTHLSVSKNGLKVSNVSGELLYPNFVHENNKLYVQNCSTESATRFTRQGNKLQFEIN